MRRRRLAPLLALSVTATLAPALATSTATAAPAASLSAAKGALDRYVKQKPQWKRCLADSPAEFECATIKVPLDYRVPGGKRIGLAISRIKSTAPDERHGVLFSNPGGPGEKGLYTPLGMQDKLPKSAQQKYDLIGFDPRGVAQSGPVSCGLEPEEAENWLQPYKEETFDKDVAWARDVANKCREKAGDTLPYITTRNTARDMDLIRAILGEKKISYVGYSYGTYLGAVYTQLFPGRADRFVLDSAVDPVRAWRGMIQWWAEGAEPAYDRWTEWAARRSEKYGLGDTPKEVDRTFWDLVAQADEKPIEADGRPATGDDIRSGMRMAVFTPQDATEGIVELRKAAAGESASAKKLAVFAGAEGTGTAGAAADTAEVPSDNPTASFWAVVCGDNSAAWSRDPESYRQDAIKDKGRYPLFGDFASSIKPCAFWDKSVEPATRVNNKVGSLIVQNEWDSQTPLPSAQALHAELKGSKMVTVLRGEGHGVYPNGNACTDGAVNDYLLTGKLPAKDVTCQATADSNAEPRKNHKRDTLPGPRLPEHHPDRF
ncbi:MULTISPECIES: alpha/beta hydrolase [unclassified Streptomyces]|uniref:alpha/beta hydrolase n=1 Tax=unclassified Streptomyces TaxID=2593676 RepID=UPI0008238D66|nr:MULTISPECIES: alpha/beta hydrolase [unclassified Streptomyces]MYU00281.1 alpha/beta fold hydrolase [Streptomyces sp. SID8350]SCK63225.1 Predicted hydrolases or acyltransferases (alpha/beta hydrolase superfamily) [Streptomyces sp. AmelKG-D3]